MNGAEIVDQSPGKNVSKIQNLPFTNVNKLKTIITDAGTYK